MCWLALGSESVCGIDGTVAGGVDGSGVGMVVFDGFSDEGVFCGDVCDVAFFCVVDVVSVGCGPLNCSCTMKTA